MKYFFDTEFIEDGKTIDLISIGIVAEDGRELYCVNQDAKLHLANDFVRINVLPHLPKYDDPAWMKHNQIKKEIITFILDFEGYPRYYTDKVASKVECWAYYGAYDWVAFCQLFGTMIDLPDYLPQFCMDLKQLSVMKGKPQHPKQIRTEHNALEDARWNKQLYDFLIKL